MPAVQCLTCSQCMSAHTHVLSIPFPLIVVWSQVLIQTALAHYMKHHDERIPADQASPKSVTDPLHPAHLFPTTRPTVGDDSPPYYWSWPWKYEQWSLYQQY
eukprot:m.281798 g.281798  ORF g.281798 m.281798 type:complete len:102 (-) comp15754_c0_seq6:3057-3362(-)